MATRSRYATISLSTTAPTSWSLPSPAGRSQAASHRRSVSPRPRAPQLTLSCVLARTCCPCARVLRAPAWACSSVEGHNITGFYSTDFTAEEIATLNAVQPFPFRSHDHDVGSRVLTIQDIFALFQREWRGGQGSALYMEIKHPKFHAKLVRALRLTSLASAALVRCTLYSGAEERVWRACRASTCRRSS